MPKLGEGSRGIRPLLFIAVGACSVAQAEPCPAPRLLPAYAHNDYYNAHPLTDALALGYQGVEADYVVVQGRVLVAHSHREAEASRTLERLYLAPLRARVQRCGWVQSPERPFLLNIESKEKNVAGYRVLRDLLTAYSDVVGTASRPGAVQVVLVGWHPDLSEIAADTMLRIAVQARLTRSGLGLPAGDTALVGMVSLDYGKTMQWRGRGALNAGDRQTLAQVAAAHLASPGRLVRAFNVPPVAAVYQLLLRAGVDLIGTKDLKQTAEILGRLRRDPPLRSE